MLKHSITYTREGVSHTIHVSGESRVELNFIVSRVITMLQEKGRTVTSEGLQLVMLDFGREEKRVAQQLHIHQEG